MSRFTQDLDMVDTTAVVAEVCAALHIHTKAGRAFIRVILANAIEVDRNQVAYGPASVSDFGLYGMIIRMNDDMQKVKRLISAGKRRAKLNREIVECIRTLSNNCTIALVMDEGKWPENE